MTPTLRKENPLSVPIPRSNYRPIALILFIRPKLLKEELYWMLSLFLSHGPTSVLPTTQTTSFSNELVISVLPNPILKAQFSSFSTFW